jgi:hypothetical protein
VTFILYGILPTAIIVYIMGTPQRKKARLALEQAEMATKQEQNSNETPPKA